MTTETTDKRLVHTIDGAAEVAVEHHSYATDAGPLAFDLYRPLHGRPSAAVVFVTGLPDPGVAAMLGKPLKDWAFYVGWGRLVAASGMVGITYTNRSPADVLALVHHLRANAGALGIDPARLGVWSSSGNVPTALGLVAHEPFACAALLYGYTIDLGGTTRVADAAARFYFAVPPVSIDELPREMPMLIVRAGRDETPGLDENLQEFIAAARASRLAVTVLDHPEAPHAFDLVDDSPATHAVIEQILAFLRQHLTPPT